MKSAANALLLIILSLNLVHGQDLFKFRPVHNIDVLEGENPLDLAWAGGINAAQFGSIDLNHDGLQDLTIFDRTTNKITTFISDGTEYHYEPEYEYLFPENINSWMLLADFNCDNKVDIFTNTTFGFKVYRNTSDQQLSFTLEQDPVLTESSGQMINLQVSSSDLPSISDVDGDGDLDFLVFRFATGNSIEYHKNLSIENGNNCDQLQFKLATNSWGNFRECDCGVYAFGEDCALPGGRIQHAGGKSLLTFDQDQDGDLELIFGDEFCTNIAFLNNFGDAENALFTEAVLDYPNSTNPVDFFIFPGIFMEDLNFDGRQDLIASPNVFENLGNQIDFEHSSHFYPNDGVSGSEHFTFQSDEFLQDRMMEFGESAAPAFFDIDGDGDQDLLVGQKGNLLGTEFIATFHLFENIGTTGLSEFKVAESDFLNISSANLNTLKPSFGDLDGDGRQDLLFSAANSTGQTNIYYLLNTANSGFETSSSSPQLLEFEIQAGDHPHFVDLNQDGRADLLLGKRTGRLEYWLNITNLGTPDFELLEDAVAGITDDSFRRELVPLATDINGDGNLELITIDATGVMRLYREFLDNQESSNIQAFDLLIEASDGQPLQRSRLGRGAVLVSANLGSLLPHLVVGSKQGGMLLMENLSHPGGAPGGVEFTLELFPNPGVSSFIILRGNQRFIFEVYNNLGQLVFGNAEMTGQVLVRFDSRLLEPGMYLVRGVSESGARQTKKLLISR